MSEKSLAESERDLKKGSRFDKDSLQSAPSLSVDNPCPSEPSPLLSLTLTGSLQTGDGMGEGGYSFYGGGRGEGGPLSDHSPDASCLPIIQSSSRAEGGRCQRFGKQWHHRLVKFEDTRRSNYDWRQGRSQGHRQSGE